MGLDLDPKDGQTGLDDDEKEGLRITTITTHAELDEYEQLNIEKAIEWTIPKRFKADDLLTEDFIKLLHKKMLNDVWKWAGEFRRTKKNIDVDWIQIGINLRMLLDDTRIWIANKVYPPEEIAIRFKHRLVSIHCFPNGNGRHSRIMADLIIEKIFNEPIFTWGNFTMLKADETRQHYIKALKEADHGNIGPLIEFSRS
ncbi:MAG TPA: mobile mystery protein B [Gillisia sp.]|nr:mobile mystery protein B [Gillisia sp.]